MFGDFVIVADPRDPGVVILTGRASRDCQTELTAALERAARHGPCRLDLTGLDGLHVNALDMLVSLATELDVEVLVRPGSPIARVVDRMGLIRGSGVPEMTVLSNRLPRQNNAVPVVA